MTMLFVIFSIVLMCIIIAVIYFIWRIMKSSSATWIKITTFFIGIIIILSIIGMLMQFLMIIIFQIAICNVTLCRVLLYLLFVTFYIDIFVRLCYIMLKGRLYI